MRTRSFLILTAIVSSLLGAVVAWLVLTVPNDLQAGAMMKAARNDVAAGRNDKARQELSRIIQQYPRTDAAAAATVPGNIERNSFLPLHPGAIRYYQIGRAGQGD